MEVVTVKKSETDRKTLLIVDDVELFLQLQVSYLGNRRFEIHTAKSGTEALDKARSLKPDLILLDMFMPDITGDVVCRTLKEDPDTSAIPVIIVSSGSKGDSRAKSEAAGCDGLIYKPVRKDLLITVVEKFLNITMRRHLRARVYLPAKVILEEAEISATIHSLGTEGAFIEIENKAIAGDLVELRFNLPDTDKEVSVRTAAVVWCGNLDKDGPRGVGVRFLSIYSEAADSIEKYLKLITDKESDREKMFDDMDTGKTAPY